MIVTSSPSELFPGRLEGCLGFAEFELVVGGMSSFKHLGIVPTFVAMLMVKSIYQVVVTPSHDVLVGSPGFDVCGPEVGWECCFS